MSAPMMLKELIQGLPLEVKGSRSGVSMKTLIRGIAQDSRLCAPGVLFVAKRGGAYDGALFMHQAVEAGAVALLSDCYNPMVQGVIQLVHPQPEYMEAVLAARFYQNPSKELFVCGVTGTNGKTSTTTLVKRLLDHVGTSCGLVSTIETVVGERRFDSVRTTHDVIFNHRVLREMRVHGHQAASLEVSSHGLAQGRVNEIEFDVALFTNLTRDHLDYHRTMEEYASAKGVLFDLLEKGTKTKRCAVVNGDDPYAQKMVGRFSGERILFGTGEKCDVRAREIDLSAEGSSFEVCARGKVFPMRTPLVGLFNVYNLLGVAAVGIHLGISLEEMGFFFSVLQGVSGRLERVPNEKGIHLFVDYAHTEDALDQVLKTLRRIAPGRIIVVFGVGGGRDEGRKRGLARAAERGADLAIVTSDNPRQEDPEHICRQILAGFSSRSRVCVEIDRRKAIERAVHSAHRGDVVLIAGKGHECTQTFAHETVPFDDRAIAREFLG